MYFLPKVCLSFFWLPLNLGCENLQQFEEYCIEDEDEVGNRHVYYDMID